MPIDFMTLGRKNLLTLPNCYSVTFCGSARMQATKAHHASRLFPSEPIEKTLCKVLRSLSFKPLLIIESMFIMHSIRLFH